MFHDWPAIRELEKHISDDVQNPENLQYALNRNFGSIELYNLIRKLKPKYVFAGHVHMPLDLELTIDDLKTRFIALDKLRNYKNEIYLLDTDDLKLHPISFKT